MSGENRSYLLMGGIMDLNKIKEDCLPFIQELGLSLFSLEYKKENDNNVLEFVIDKKGFVDILEIEKVTEKINEYLDNNDSIEDEYSLSITSRGVEKEIPFDDLSYYKNEWLDVKTIDQLHTGELVEVATDSLTIKTVKNKKVKINANDIVSIKTIVKF